MAPNVILEVDISLEEAGNQACPHLSGEDESIDKNLRYGLPFRVALPSVELTR